MALTTRILKATLSMPGGDVVLDQTLEMKIKISKAALAIQNRATIDVIGLTTSLREQLLSQFTAWKKRQVETGQIQQNWINIKIEAGNDDNTNSEPSVIFKGQVVLCEPSSPPPNIGVRITCYSRQIDRTSFISTPAPAQTTFANYVAYAAAQMGFDKNFICDTSYNDVVIYNPARSIHVAAALLIDIQNMYRPDVAAFIDDDILIVKDRNKIINPSNVAQVTEFIGTPSWTEWGVDFTTLFNPSIRLAQAAALTSLMNPSLNNTYVIMELEYDMTTRGTAFYVKASGSPPA
jgi:hypothetical protein